MPTTIALRTPTRGTAKRTGASRDTESLVIPMHSTGMSNKRLGPTRDTESLVISTSNDTRQKTMDFSQFDFHQNGRKGSPRRPSTSASATSPPNFSKRKPSVSKGSRDDVSYSPFPLASPSPSTGRIKSPSTYSGYTPTTPRSLPLRKSSSYSMLSSPKSHKTQRKGGTPEPGNIGMALGNPSTARLGTPTSSASAHARSTWVHTPESGGKQDPWSAKLQRRPSMWLSLGSLFGMGKGKKRSDSVPHTFYQVQPQSLQTSRQDLSSSARSVRSTRNHSMVETTVPFATPRYEQERVPPAAMPGPEVPEKPYKAVTPVQSPTKQPQSNVSKRPKPAIRRSQMMPLVAAQEAPAQSAQPTPTIKIDSGPAAVHEEEPAPVEIDGSSVSEPKKSNESHSKLSESREEKRDRKDKERRERVDKLEKLSEEPEKEATVPELIVERPVTPPPQLPQISSLAPQLELELPSFKMERFSIMFSGLMDNKDGKRASALLSRRQATLDKLKDINDAADKEAATLEANKSAAATPKASPAVSALQTPRTVNSQDVVSPLQSTFAGELDRTFGIALSADALSPGASSGQTPLPTPVKVPSAQQVVERASPPMNTSRESFVQPRTATEPFKPGASNLILDDADSDEDVSVPQQQRRSKLKSAPRTASPSMPPNHSVSGSTSSSDMSNTSTWSNAPWSSAPSSELSLSSGTRTSPQASPKTVMSKASSSATATPKASTPTAVRSVLPTTTPTTPKAKMEYVPTQRGNSTAPSSIASPHTRTGTSSASLTPVATTTTTITAGNHSDRTSSASPSHTRISSALPPTIETFIPTSEPFDFGLLSPAQDDEKRLTDAAAVSIARQISVSRDQRKLLAPLSGAQNKSRESLSVIRPGSVEVPQPLRIAKIAKNGNKSNQLASDAAAEARKRSIEAPSTPPVQRKPYEVMVTPPENRKPLSPGFIPTRHATPAHAPLETMFVSNAARSSVSPAAFSMVATTPAETRKPEAAPVVSPPSEARPEAARQPSRPTASPPSTSREREGRKKSQSTSTTARDGSAPAGVEGRSKKSHSTTRESTRDRAHDERKGERTGRARASTVGREKEREREKEKGSDKIWPNAAHHWAPRKSSIDQHRVNGGSASSAFGSTEVTASPLKAALDANEASGLLASGGGGGGGGGGHAKARDHSAVRHKPRKSSVAKNGEDAAVERLVNVI